MASNWITGQQDYPICTEKKDRHCAVMSQKFSILNHLLRLNPQSLCDENVTYLQVSSGFQKHASLSISLYISEEKMGNTFVLHNELFQYYLLSDDWILARALVGRK